MWPPPVPAPRQTKALASMGLTSHPPLLECVAGSKNRTDQDTKCRSESQTGGSGLQANPTAPARATVTILQPDARAAVLQLESRRRAMSCPRVRRQYATAVLATAHARIPSLTSISTSVAAEISDPIDRHENAGPRSSASETVRRWQVVVAFLLLSNPLEGVLLLVTLTRCQNASANARGPDQN